MRQFRQDKAQNPEYYSQLLQKSQLKQYEQKNPSLNYANHPDDLQYTTELVGSKVKAISKTGGDNQLISNMSAFNASG